MKRKVLRVIYAIIFGLCLLATVGIIIAQVLHGINFNFPVIMWIVLAVVLAGGTALGIWQYRKSRQLQKWLKTHSQTLKIIAVIALALGVVARLSFIYLAKDYNPGVQISDPGIHWVAGQELASGDGFSETTGVYEAKFPFLTSYTGLLSLFMRIMPPYMAVVVLNTLCDIASGILLFALVSRWRGRKAGWMVAVLWALNPAEIIMCGVSLPAVTVNLWIILSLYLVYRLLTNQGRKWWQILLFTAGIGVVLATANVFRPVCVVLLIATIIALVVKIFQDWRGCSKFQTTVLPWLCSIPILIVTYIGAGMAYTGLYQAINPYSYDSGIMAGWNFLVGANFDSRGMWNVSDLHWFVDTVLPEQGQDFAAASQVAFNTGLERYQAMLPWQIFEHFGNKITVLFATTGYAVSDFTQVFSAKPIYQLFLVLSDIIVIFVLALVLLTGVFFYRTWRSRSDNLATFFLSVAMLGFISASLLVEVMPRYIFPTLNFFIIFAAVALTLPPAKKSQKTIALKTK